MHVRAVTHLKRNNEQTQATTQAKILQLSTSKWRLNVMSIWYAHGEQWTVNTIYILCLWQTLYLPFDRSFLHLFKWLNGHWIIFTNIFLRFFFFLTFFFVFFLCWFKYNRTMNDDRIDDGKLSFEFWFVQILTVIRLASTWPDERDPCS